MPQTSDIDYECYRVMLVGDGGKSSIMLRYCENKFELRHMMTIGVDFKTKIINVDSDKIRLQIWDTAGQERFRNITPVYFRSSNGIVLVYDVTSVESFDNISYWLSSLESHGSSDKPTTLVGNKIDLAKRKVSRRKAETLAQKHNIPYYETSALENTGIEEMFRDLARQIRTRARSQDPRSVDAATRRKPFKLEATEHGGAQSSALYLQCCSKMWKRSEPISENTDKKKDSAVVRKSVDERQVIINPPAASVTAHFGKLNTSNWSIARDNIPLKKRATAQPNEL